MIVVHVDRGLDKPYARAYADRVDYRRMLSHVDSEYACGRYPANYPLPAIPLKVKFEWRDSGSKFPRHTTSNANDQLALRIYKRGQRSRIGNAWQSWFGRSVRFTNNYDGEFS